MEIVKPPKPHSPYLIFTSLTPWASRIDRNVLSLHTSPNHLTPHVLIVAPLLSPLEKGRLSKVVFASAAFHSKALLSAVCLHIGAGANQLTNLACIIYTVKSILSLPVTLLILSWVRA
ncbi:hypothetical protein CCHR01_07675 [Colletotrichum chrysophilum]|uniref:Uncharacterized protein n=1 Tax=Colletotrichum chrysophilum TaxID=1836956 RepID=A0AAD9AK56_9PEZI|nr:hypothetical protein CCHR01_07675 [Colletotrichum chrysophilum]